MGIFSKSRVFHRSVRKEQDHRKAELKEMLRRAYEPKLVQVERVLTEEERCQIAEMHLRDKGIEKPKHPNEICAKPLSEDDMWQACRDGIGVSDMATDLMKLGSFKKTLSFLPGCVTGISGMLANAVKQEKECRDRRGPDYEKQMNQYNTQFAYELSKVPKTDKTLEFVPATDPRHPKYQPPQKNQPHLRPNTGNNGNWNFTIYSTGDVHGGRAIFKF